MKTLAFLCPLIARALSLASILLSLNPASAAEIIGYRQVCPRDGSPCRTVPVYRQSAPVVLIDVVAARPEEYVSFAADSGELPARAPISFASQTVIVDQSFPAVSSVASITATPSLAGSGNCGCAVNGVCTCGANCACANCPCASMPASPLTTYTTSYSSAPAYAASNSSFSLPADHTTRQHRRFDRLNRRAVKYGLQ